MFGVNYRTVCGVYAEQRISIPLAETLRALDKSAHAIAFRECIDEHCRNTTLFSPFSFPSDRLSPVACHLCDDVRCLKSIRAFADGRLTERQSRGVQHALCRRSQPDDAERDLGLAQQPSDVPWGRGTCGREEARER